MDNILPIVYSIDDNYTLPVMVAIRSLQINKQDKYKLKIYIFNAELKEENQLKIKSIEKPDCQIEFVSVNEYIKGANLYDCHDFSVAMYYRFFIPIILSQYEKVLYLDTDTLVKGCVSKIFKEDLTGFSLGACYDFGMVNNPKVSKSYINSGVILYNCAEYNRNNFAQKCVEYVNANQNLGYPDQDTINEVCKGKIRMLSPVYNFLTVNCWDTDKWGTQIKKGLKLTKIKSLNDVLVFHYAGTKPWVIKNTPLANLWWKVAKTLPTTFRKELKQYHLIKKKEVISYYNEVTSKKYYNGYIVMAQQCWLKNFRFKIKKLLGR